MPVSPRTVVVSTDHGAHSISFSDGTTLRDALLSAGLILHSSCGGSGTCGLCVVRLEESGVIPFTLAERARLSGAQLADSLRLACQIHPDHISDTPLHVSLVSIPPRAHWRALREDEYGAFNLPQSLRSTRAHYGVAIDLGTTHIRLSLWNVADAKRLAGRAGLNPQGSYGADVLNRLMAATSDSDTAREMRVLTVQAIGEALWEMCTEAGIKPDEIGEILTVGNTAMLSLLAGKNFDLLMQPQYWTQRIDCQPDDEALFRAAWQLAPEAKVNFLQPMGGFIGSDLLAGLLATRFVEQSSSALLIDFGTNSEMALWDGQNLRVTSTAGGPAFEGSGISCGMPADAGAIYHAQLDAEGRLQLQVLGDESAKGVCGSGLVDVVALLRSSGKLDKVGRLAASIGQGFVLAENPFAIVLHRGDVDVLQRAKAAIGAGVQWLCAQSGLPLTEIQRVYVCGAFGRWLNIAQAQAIGLLPPVAAERVQLEGNSALAGCEMLLLAAQREQMQKTMSKLAEVHNLAEDIVFESMFVENLYLQQMQG